VKITKITLQDIYYKVTTTLLEYDITIEEFLATDRFDFDSAELKDLSLMYKSEVQQYLDERNAKRDEYVSLYAKPETWGWHWIIERTHKHLSYLDKNYTVDQIKEKFGGLRYYYNPTDHARNDETLYSIMDELVRYAEMLAAHTCEYCGNCSLFGPATHKQDSSVKLRDDHYWLKTLCDTCNDERNVKVSKAQSE
jgi:hypothetical protein